MNREEMERRVAEIIQEEVGISYVLNSDGTTDPSNLRLHAVGAASAIVYEVIEWLKSECMS